MISIKYLGSKSRIAKFIVPILQKEIDDNNINVYIEPFVEAESKAQAIQKISDKDWNDIIDTYDCDELTEGCEVLEIWVECD